MNLLFTTEHRTIVSETAVQSFTMSAFSSFQPLLLFSLFILALTSAEGPKPGDPIDWSVPFQQWWHDIKDVHESREVRK